MYNQYGGIMKMKKTKKQLKERSDIIKDKNLGDNLFSKFDHQKQIFIKKLSL